MSDYNSIREQCLEERKLWEDPDFPAVMSSVFYHQVPPFQFQWKRPEDIYKNAVFMANPPKFDVVAGSLGDKWLVTCMDILFMFRGLFFRTLPREQELGDEYLGILRFHLWYNGKWQEVLIDDRLPTLNGQLVFLHSKNPQEFWPSLFEKAYAKVLGSYEAIKYGNIRDGLSDMTGGITEQIKLKHFDLLENILMPKTIVVAKYQPHSPLAVRSDLNEGAYYRVCETRRPNTKGNSLNMVKISGCTITPRVIRKKVKLPHPRDFALFPEKAEDIDSTWIPFTDFCKDFPVIDCLHLSQQSRRFIDWDPDKIDWLEQSCDDSWKRGISAGGCKNQLSTGYFHTNPQILIKTKSVSNLILACLYQHRVTDPCSIGFSIFQANDLETKIAPKSFFCGRRSFLNSEYSNSRRIIGRMVVGPGSFIIVPSTFIPNCEVNFTLRLYTLHPISMEYLDEPLSMVEQFMKPTTPGAEDYYGFYEGIFLQLADEYKSVNVYDLQECLETCLPNDHIKSCCTLDTCRQIILTMDRKNSSRIQLSEFKDFLFNLRQWQAVFDNNAKERMGVLRSERLRDVLSHLGFTVPTHVLVTLTLRFIKKDGMLRFGDFVNVVLYLCRICNQYQTQKAYLTAEELDMWLLNTLKF